MTRSTVDDHAVESVRPSWLPPGAPRLRRSQCLVRRRSRRPPRHIASDDMPGRRLHMGRLTLL